MRNISSSTTLGLAVALLLCAAVSVASPLIDAVKSGELSQVVAIVNKTEDLNTRDVLGRTALHWAIELNAPAMARVLIGQGADFEQKDNAGKAPLHVAAEAGNVEIAQLLLEQGTACLNETTLPLHGGSVGQWTPLHLACLNGHPEMVRLLLEHGADLEVRDGYRRTPLILTGQSKNAITAENLVAHGADINAAAIRNYTALLWAARNDFEPMVNFLIGQKAGITAEMLPLAFQLAVINGLDSLYGHTVGLGVNIEEVLERDPGFIFPASSGGSARIVRTLLEAGFEPNQADEAGWTPLHYSAAENHASVVTALLDAGAAIDARTAKGETAFNLANAHGHVETLKVLESRGGDTSAPKYPLFEGAYMGQAPPGDTPQIFLPGIVSGHYRAHSSLTFSPDAAEAYWTEMSPGEGAVRYSRIENGHWTYPTTAPVERDPTFSPDGNRLYYIRTRPFEPGETPGGDPDVKEEYWFLERTDTGWSEARSVGPAVNRIGVHWPCSVDRDGNLYFSEFSRNMYCSRLIEGVYQEPELLTTLFKNETLIGRSPFISPEGDYLLFSGDSGICVTFRRDDGRWTDRLPLGSPINASHENGCPRVTTDGKYIFFVSAGQGRPWGIYWVSSGVIERLREGLLVK